MSKASVADRRLIFDDEIHAAALWRLAGWSEAEIEAGLAAVDRALKASPDLRATSAHVQAVLDVLARAGGRRDPWTALAALAVLKADRCGNVALYWRAGLEVLQAHRQAVRGTAPRPGSRDALDELIEENLSRRPGMTARELFEHFSSLVPLGVGIVEATDKSLTFEVDPDGRKLRPITLAAFKVRVTRARHRLAEAAEARRPAPGVELVAVTRSWGHASPQDVQPVAVTAAA